MGLSICFLRELTPATNSAGGSGAGGVGGVVSTGAGGCR